MTNDAMAWMSVMLRRWQGLLGGSDSEKPKVPRGLYMHGGVGTGKTMLMDLFAESALPEFQASHGCHTLMWLK